MANILPHRQNGASQTAALIGELLASGQFQLWGWPSGTCALLNAHMPAYAEGRADLTSDWVTITLVVEAGHTEIDVWVVNGPLVGSIPTTQPLRTASWIAGAVRRLCRLEALDG